MRNGCSYVCISEQNWKLILAYWGFLRDDSYKQVTAYGHKLWALHVGVEYSAVSYRSE